MPYSLSEPSKLPSNVQKLSAKKKRIWVGAFNSSFASCEKDGGEDCEGRAFAIANSAIKKTFEAELKDEKAMSLYDQHTEVMRSWWDYVEKYKGQIIQVLGDKIILEYFEPSGESEFKEVPYTITGDEVIFGEPVDVERVFIPRQEQELEISQVPVKTVEIFDNTLKALSKDDDTLVVGNYLALFGGRDLEGTATPRKNKDGSAGEYFTANTSFESDFTKSVGRLPVDWEHGSIDSSEEPGKDDILGFVDWSTAKADTNGLFVQRVLNRRNKYVSMLETLIENGLIGTSSEAQPGKVQKAADGEILTWPLVRDSLTVCPMEPRMLSQNVLTTLKALADEVEEFKKSCITAGVLEEEDGEKLKLEVLINKSILDI